VAGERDDAERLAARRRATRRTRLAAFGFVLPVVLYSVLFFLYPIVRTGELSLQHYTFMSYFTGQADFVGLENYVTIFGHPLFSTVVLNTAVFTVVSLVFQFAIGLALAVFFNRTFPLSALFRSLILVPWLLPVIVSATTWRWMFYKDYGIVNALLGTHIGWLSDPSWSLWAVIIANIWLGIPFNLVLLYCGLQAIPGGVYEAASLDGAGAWRQFRSITLPLLRPVSAITILLGLIYTLKVVDVIWIMTTGGPADASTTFAVWSYREAFGTGQPDFSPAAAVGNILILVALVFGFLHLQLQRRQEAS